MALLIRGKKESIRGKKELIRGKKELIQQQECQHRNSTNVFSFFLQIFKVENVVYFILFGISCLAKENVIIFFTEKYKSKTHIAIVTIVEKKILHNCVEIVCI